MSDAFAGTGREVCLGKDGPESTKDVLRLGLGMNPQPRSGDLSVVGPWIGDDSQPHSGDLSVGSMAKIIKFIVARTSKWLGLSRPTPNFETPLRC